MKSAVTPLMLTPFVPFRVGPTKARAAPTNSAGSPGTAGSLGETCARSHARARTRALARARARAQALLGVEGWMTEARYCPGRQPTRLLSGGPARRPARAPLGRF